MKQRIITAIVAAAVFLPLAFIGGISFTILVYLMAMVALFELLRMRNISMLSFPGIFSQLMLLIFLVPSEYNVIFQHINVEKTELFFLGVLIFLSYSVLAKNKFSFNDIAFSILAILYLGIGFYYLIETRETGGIIPLFFALALIWSTDSGAYFVGRAMGNRKLWPDISPNKTIEGSIGGIACAIIVALLFYYLTEIGDLIDLWQLIVYSILLSIFGQLGDLVESALKRFYNTKDTGKLLPGHGGVLDRVDSWLFVMPLLHILNIL